MGGCGCCLLIPDAARWPHNAERVRYLRDNYYRDGRLYPETPRSEWWKIGKIFRKTTRGWLDVNYDSDGLEIGGDPPATDQYREWLRRMRT